MKIVSVVGARPNFIKVAPLCRALAERKGVEHLLVHTGQHYDGRMSGGFFEELGIPRPDVNLGVGSGTHAEQVGRTMVEFEKVVRAERPDWVVVIGDVNAVCACSITAKKEHVRCAHVEAGLRSGDIDMPEEVNRLVADRLCDLLFAPDAFAVANLRAEGVPEERIVLAGNIMIDTLERERERAAAIPLESIAGRRLDDGAFAAMTLHRPSNVDGRETLSAIVGFVADEVAKEIPVVWPVHPRTRKRLEEFGLWEKVSGTPGLIPVEPLGYRETLRLNLGARLFLTDSGGLQEECCVAGTPCLTLRDTTERPVTLQENGGASVLTGNDVGRIRAAFRRELAAPRRPSRPPLWDGRTAERIAAVLAGEAK